MDKLRYEVTVEIDDECGQRLMYLDFDSILWALQSYRWYNSRSAHSQGVSATLRRK